LFHSATSSGAKNTSKKKERNWDLSWRTMLQLDKYAADANTWEQWANIDYIASLKLFESGNALLFFPAATLAHHSLEMYLKAALIRQGMTVFDPNKIRKLDPGIALIPADCAWGHGLLKLAQELHTTCDRRQLKFPLNDN
jgi:hypothetical protein